MSIWFGTPTVDDANSRRAGTMIEHLGIEFTELADDMLAGRMPVDARTRQPAGMLHGGASVVLPDDEGFAELAARFDPPEHAVRSVIRVDVERIADSCGYGVPMMRFDRKRDQYEQWVDAKVRDGGFDDYIAEKNAASIDGLPAI